MLYVDEVPAAVTINEAVNLAKEFGGEDESHRFVNGVLGSIAVRIGAPYDGGEPDGDVPSDEDAPDGEGEDD